MTVVEYEARREEYLRRVQENLSLPKNRVKERTPRPRVTPKKPQVDRRFRRVVCVETGEEFPSITEAVKSLCTDLPERREIKKIHQMIWRSCHGSYTPVAGKTWRYAEDKPPQREPLWAGLKQPVICVETGQQFDSIKQAAEWVVGPDASPGKRQSVQNHISRILSGGRHSYYNWKKA